MLVAQVSISLPAIFHLVNRVTRHGFGSLFTDREYARVLPKYTSSSAKSHSHDPEGFVRLTTDIQLTSERSVAWPGKDQSVQLGHLTRVEASRR